jgi:cation transport ATPase
VQKQELMPSEDVSLEVRIPVVQTESSQYNEKEEEREEEEKQQEEELSQFKISQLTPEQKKEQEQQKEKQEQQKYNYIWDKKTNEIVDHPEVLLVFINCVKLVCTLWAIGLFTFIPCFGWSLFDTFYITINSPFLPACPFCQILSQALSVLALVSFPFISLIAIYGWSKVKQFTIIKQP